MPISLREQKLFSLLSISFLPSKWRAHKHNRLFHVWASCLLGCVWWSVTNVSWCLAQREYNKVKQRKKQNTHKKTQRTVVMDPETHRDQNKLCGLAEVNMTHLCAPSWQQDAAACFLQGAKKQNLSAAPDNKQRIRVCEGTALCKQLCSGRFERRLHTGRKNVRNSKRQCYDVVCNAPLVSMNL